MALDVVGGLGMLEEGMLEELLGSWPLAGLFYQAETDELLERLQSTWILWSVDRAIAVLSTTKSLDPESVHESRVMLRVAAA